MSQTVQVEGVGQVTFPDDATQEEIHKALNDQFPPEPPLVQQLAGTAKLTPKQREEAWAAFQASPIPETNLQGETIPGKIGAAAVNVADRLARGAVSPMGAFALPLGMAGAVPRAAMGLGFGVPIAVSGVKKMAEGGGLQPVVEGALETAAGALMAGGGVKGALPKRVVNALKKGAQDAIPVGKPETLPVEVPPGGGQEVGARVPGPEELAPAQAPTPDVPPQDQPPAAGLAPAPQQGKVEGGEVVGMGGAAIGEVEPTGTALKNAVGELERAGLGLPEAYPTVRHNMAKAWIKAGEVVGKDPGAGRALADDLIANPERGMTDEESALLLRHKVDIFNKMNDAAEKSHVGDEASRTAAMKEYEALSAHYLDLLDAIKFRGSEWGREGRWRQALAKEDYDFSSTDSINRFHRSNTGDDLTPDQKVDADKVAKGVKTAVDASDKADQELSDHIRKKGVRITDAEKNALDAAWKTVREAAARMAAGVSKKRVEDVVREMETSKIQDDASARGMTSAVDRLREAAIKAADAENKARVAKSVRDKAVSAIQTKATQRALDAASKAVRDAARRAAETERKNAADPSKPLWEKAKSYLDQGIDHFDDIRHKLATDFGMPVERVTRLLAQDARAKYLADDMWAKQQDARRLKEQAKRWVTNLDVPMYRKALASVPKILFGLKVGFHGTVALGTHAPMVAFQPKFWATYVHDFGKMYKMVGSKTYYERQVQDLMRRPNYNIARRSGLVNDPFVYEDYSSPDTAKYFGGLTGMGNRGYTVLKILRQDMFDQMWNRLPKTTKIKQVAEAISDGLNHATGVVKGAAPRGTNIALFAPRLEASRVMWLTGDPLRAADTFLRWNKADIGEKQFALNQVKEKAWVAGTMASMLALNAGFLASANAKQKINFTDPFKSDFLKFKAAGMDLSYGNAMLSMARLPLRLWVGIKNEGKLNKIVHEDENTAKTLFDYARSQASPFMGLLLDLAFGRDYQQRPLPRAGFGMLPGRTDMPKRLKAQGLKPYSWGEFASEQLSPIPFQEAIKEVWGKGMGMGPDQQRALATILVMAGTGSRLTTEVTDKKPAPVDLAPYFK